MKTMMAYRFSAVMGFLAVCLGAFGAHSLKDLLAANGTASVWQTAALYHLVHSVVLLGLASRAELAQGAWRLFAIGILIFSGSLYVVAITNIRWFGAITPVGGACLLGGWLMLAIRR